MRHSVTRPNYVFGSGVTHEGAPKGNWEVINGVNSYVALPTGEYSSDVAIILLSDVFGVQLINTRLLADDFAKNGFQVCPLVSHLLLAPSSSNRRPCQTYIPDYLNNDPIPVNGMSRGSSFDTAAWLRRHGKEATRGTLDEFILGLSERGVLVFGAVGYSFGARYVFDLAFDNVVTAAVVNHPSLLYIPDDLEVSLISKDRSKLYDNTVSCLFVISPLVRNTHHTQRLLCSSTHARMTRCSHLWRLP